MSVHLLLLHHLTGMDMGRNIWMLAGWDGAKPVRNKCCVTIHLRKCKANPILGWPRACSSVNADPDACYRSTRHQAVNRESRKLFNLPSPLFQNLYQLFGGGKSKWIRVGTYWNWARYIGYLQICCHLFLYPAPLDNSCSGPSQNILEASSTELLAGFGERSYADMCLGLPVIHIEVRCCYGCHINSLYFALTEHKSNKQRRIIATSTASSSLPYLSSCRCVWTCLFQGCITSYAIEPRNSH